MATEETAERAAMPVLMTGIDDAWARLSTRLRGITQAEYLWEPVAPAWNVRQVGEGWEVDRDEPDPTPAPVTTIAWRMWHIGSDCLAGYVSPSLGEWPLRVSGREWFGEVDAAIEEMAVAFQVFRARIEGLGEDGLWRRLGPAWGPFAESTWADLVVHALDELAHHGAEIGLLRDLYLHRPGGR